MSHTGIARLVVVLGVVVVLGYVGTVWSAPDNLTVATGAVALAALIVTIVNLWLTHLRGPEITAVEPPSVVLENDPDLQGPSGRKLRIYVPLTFTNEGAAPGVVCDLKLTVRGADCHGNKFEWRTDWPGENDPVTRKDWEPRPIPIPPRGHAERVVCFYVSDNSEKEPATKLSQGDLQPQLEANVGTKLAKRTWVANVRCDDANRLARRGEEYSGQEWERRVIQQRIGPRDPW